jgi:N-acetylmuramoyl-L-alanine amidase
MDDFVPVGQGGHVCYNHKAQSTFGYMNLELANEIQPRLNKFFNKVRSISERPDLAVLGGHSTRVGVPAMNMPYPAILCECGFYENAKDLGLIKNDSSRTKLANEICDGVIAILSKHNRLPRM